MHPLSGDDGHQRIRGEWRIDHDLADALILLPGSHSKVAFAVDRWTRGHNHAITIPVPLSLDALVEVTGLAHSTVAHCVATLIREGVLVEGEGSGNTRWLALCQNPRQWGAYAPPKDFWEAYPQAFSAAETARKAIVAGTRIGTQNEYNSAATATRSGTENRYVDPGEGIENRYALVLNSGTKPASNPLKQRKQRGSKGEFAHYDDLLENPEDLGASAPAAAETRS